VGAPPGGYTGGMTEEPPSRDEDVPEPPNELEGPEPEPPHLQRGSPHPNEPEPYDPPNPEVP
jgi:hypothetical protein